MEDTESHEDRMSGMIGQERGSGVLTGPRVMWCFYGEDVELIKMIRLLVPPLARALMNAICCVISFSMLILSTEVPF